MKKWYYYSIETKTSQYGCHIRSVTRRKTKADCIRWKSAECDDCSGVRTRALKSQSGKSQDVEAALTDKWGRFGGPSGSGYEMKGGVEIEWL